MRRIAVFLAGAALSASAAAFAGVRVASLDQCADQYVLAMADRADIVGLSTRAEAGDSWLRARAHGLPRRRADLETLLLLKPDVVVRYWGGSSALVRALERHRVRVVTISDSADLQSVEAETRKVAAAIGQTRVGEQLVLRLRANLTDAAGAWRGRSAVYLTSGGATAGPGTLVDAVLRAAGLRNAVTKPGFDRTPLERLALSPPSAVVQGFFDSASQDRNRWSPARHAVLTRAVSGRTLASLPGALMGCPAWFAADAARMIARRAPSAAGG